MGVERAGLGKEEFVAFPARPLSDPELAAPTQDASDLRFRPVKETQARGMNQVLQKERI
jgi:hypothetical protein